MTDCYPVYKIAATFFLVENATMVKKMYKLVILLFRSLSTLYFSLDFLIKQRIQIRRCLFSNKFTLLHPDYIKIGLGTIRKLITFTQIQIYILIVRKRCVLNAIVIQCFRSSHAAVIISCIVCFSSKDDTIS